ncbi:MAG: DNA translocase FtsK [Oscillospiraceae bacterium]|nr:DNA translocase FtsK [Oscillospiraceae bacterium]
MAATQKKKTTSKQGRGKSSKSKSTQSSQKRPIRREVGAVVCLLLGVFALFGCLGVKAIFIDFFCDLVKGLVGYGLWALVPLLFVMSFLLFTHRGRPVRARVGCALLLALLFGAFVHLLAADTGTLTLSGLWYGGQMLQNGGVLAGGVAMGLTAALSAIGAGFILIVAIIICLLVVFHITPSAIVDAVRSHPRLEYEEEELPERPQKRLREDVRDEEVGPGKEPRRRRSIHLPLDGEEPEEVPPEQPADLKAVLEKQEKKGPLFNSKAAVPAPDAVLHADTAQADEEAEEAEEGMQEHLPEDDELLTAATVAAGLEIVREPAVSKKQRTREQAEATAAVTQDIEQGMESATAKYQYPPISLLLEGGKASGADVTAELTANQARLTDTIHSFGIDANICNVTRGPSVTRYELELDQGVRLNKLTNLADDIALALGAAGVRIAPIPNQISMVGIEVPNRLVTPVPIHDVIDSREFRNHKSKVAFSVGKDIGGNNIVGDIARLPHLLIAGTTGSGKSVCTNSLIISLLYKATPEEVRLIMVDPKMVELGIYNGIPHLLIPVVTDPKKAAGALQWAVTEMMKRYRAFSEVGVRDLTSYNDLAARSDEMEKMPQIVIVIDELADLMLGAAKEVEESICRVAQMGRASGMHLIIATQRPSADVITGLMKANIPSRIAFAVASALESRIILDTTGAEKLVGRGDMLYFPLGSGKPQRVQGCLISDQEVADVVACVKQSGAAEYSDEIIREIEQNAAEKEKGGKGVGGSAPTDVDNSFDELFPSAVEVVVETGMASVSMLQRRLKLGYSRAARLVDQLEEKGIVGPFEGSKPRQVLISKEQWQEMQYKQGMLDAPPGDDRVPEELPFEGDAFAQDSPPFDL